MLISRKHAMAKTLISLKFRAMRKLDNVDQISGHLQTVKSRHRKDFDVTLGTMKNSFHATCKLNFVDFKSKVHKLLISH